MKVEKDTVLYSGWDVEDARSYIARFGLTTDEVSLRKRGEDIFVVSKKEFDLCEKAKS